VSDYDVQRARATLRRHGIPELGDIYLGSVGEHGLEVHVEVNGIWRVAIRESLGGTISHHVCADGLKSLRWPVVDEGGCV